jgi:hypothetical protein
MKCERKISGKECGGEIDMVMSADEKTTWGGKCGKCGKFQTKCQGCGVFYSSLGSHLSGGGGESRKCNAANQVYRTAVAAKQIRQVEP